MKTDGELHTVTQKGSSYISYSMEWLWSRKTGSDEVRGQTRGNLSRLAAWSLGEEFIGLCLAARQLTEHE